MTDFGALIVEFSFGISFSRHVLIQIFGTNASQETKVDVANTPSSSTFFRNWLGNPVH